MATALIGMGSNVGDRAKTLERALDLMAGNVQVSSVAASRWHETLPIGGPGGQGAFLNAAARVVTSHTPPQLLGLLQQIETQLGRKRDVRWDQRTLDLDLLLYDDLVINTSNLIIPHPMMAFRRFVLEPAAEVAGEMVHPVLGRTLQSLFAHLKEAVPYAAIVGGVQAERIGLGFRVAQSCNARWIVDPSDSDDSKAANRTSLGSDRWLEFLDRRSKLIQTATWLDRGRWTISNFWLGEISLALSDDIDESVRSGVGYAWWNAQLGSMPAKLVFILDADQRFDAATIAARWRKLTAEPMMPFLLLRSSNPDVQLAESAAAMEAMQ